MAIQFVKDVSQEELLSSNNNNEVVFESNNPLEAVSCLIDFDGVSVTRRPDVAGQFSYDFMEVVSVLINENDFEDLIVPDIENNGYSYKDNSLFKEITISYKISFSNGSTETASRTYSFTKSVRQIKNYQDTIFNMLNDKLALLLPNQENSRETYYAPYFQGYPFDIALYSNADRTITVKSKSNNIETTLDVKKGVNRIFISQGEKSFTFDDEVPLRFGINELEFKIDINTYVTLFVEKMQSDCGVYVKYFNNSGGYSYYLLPKFHEKSLKTKAINNVFSNNKDISNTRRLFRTTGKTVKQSSKFKLDMLTRQQVQYLQDLLYSPFVEVYTREAYRKTELFSWNGITVSDGSFVLDKTKDKYQNLNLTIGSPILTMTK